MGHYSNFLFADPSFLEGAGRVVDLAGTLTEFNSSSTPGLADRIAIAMDWQAVGADLTAVIASHREALCGQHQEESRRANSR